MSKKPVQRQSQIITTFGPGAMIDLPTRSVLIGGLDRWKIGSDATKVIDEPVMIRILEDWLRQQGRLPEGRRLRLLTPPVQPEGYKGDPFGIDVTVFPSWFVLDVVEVPTIAGQTRRARRLVRWHELDSASGWRKFETEDGKKHDVSPLRFVGACPNGHLQDLDWRRIVHRRRTVRSRYVAHRAGHQRQPHRPGDRLQLRQESLRCARRRCEAGSAIARGRCPGWPAIRASAA